LATEAGWRFLTPFEGQRITMLGSGLERVFLEGAWSLGVVRATEVRIADKAVVSAQQPAIDAASGGAIVDLEARRALEAVLGALRAHGLIAS
jgi:hypothetical protein